MSNKACYEGRNTAVLLFSFLMGALLSFYYNDFVEKFFAKSEFIFPAVFIFIIFLSSFQLLSLTAISVQPLLSVLLGVCTAAAIYRLRELLEFGTIPYVGIASLAIVIPLYFVISGTGLTYSREIKSAVKAKNPNYNKFIFTSYSIMFFTTVSLMLFVNYIIKI